MNVLENSREYESDITLLYLVRVQRLTERIFELNSKDKAVEDIPGLPSAPMSAYIAAFQNEIETMRNTLPPNLQNDGMLFSSLLQKSMQNEYTNGLQAPSCHISTRQCLDSTNLMQSTWHLSILSRSPSQPDPLVEALRSISFISLVQRSETGLIAGFRCLLLLTSGILPLSCRN